MLTLAMKKKTGLKCGLTKKIYAGMPTVYCTTSVKHWVTTHLLHVPHEKAETEQIAWSNKGKSDNVCTVEERRGRNVNGLL